MTKRMLVLFGLLISLSGCAGNTQAADQEAGVQMKLERLKKEIVVGATEDHVVDVLESMDMGFSFITPESLMMVSVPQESDGYYKTLKGRYVSIIRDVERTALSTKAISVQIDIGLDDRVKKVNIEPVYTAP